MFLLNNSINILSNSKQLVKNKYTDFLLNFKIKKINFIKSIIYEAVITIIIQKLLIKNIPIEKQKTFTGRLHKIVHYIYMCILQYRIIKNTVWGQNIQLSIYREKKGGENMIKKNKIYNCEIFIYLLKTFISLIKIKKETRKDKYIELIHHFTTLALLFGSSLVKRRGIGIHILYIHNITGLFYNIVRVMGTLQFNKIITHLYILMFIQFAYYRVYYFNYKIIGNILKAENSELNRKEKAKFVTGLGSLSLMHIYWIYNLFSVLVIKYKSNSSLENVGSIKYEKIKNKKKAKIRRK